MFNSVGHQLLLGAFRANDVFSVCDESFPHHAGLTAGADEAVVVPVAALEWDEPRASDTWQSHTWRRWRMIKRKIVYDVKSAQTNRRGGALWSHSWEMNENKLWRHTHAYMFISCNSWCLWGWTYGLILSWQLTCDRLCARCASLAEQLSEAVCAVGLVVAGGESLAWIM